MPRRSEWVDFLQRFKLLLRHQDQPLPAFALTIGGLAFMIYYGSLSWQEAPLMTLGQTDRNDFQFQLDPNTADWPEWTILPGIGEKLARRIVDFRQQNGQFQSNQQLLRVPGIGKVKQQQLAPFMLPIEMLPIEMLPIEMLPIEMVPIEMVPIEGRLH